MPARLTGIGTVVYHGREMAYVHYDLAEERGGLTNEPALSGTITIIDGRTLPARPEALILVLADRTQAEFYFDPQNPVDHGPVRIMVTHGIRPAP